MHCVHRLPKAAFTRGGTAAAPRSCCERRDSAMSPGPHTMTTRCSFGPPAAAPASAVVALPVLMSLMPSRYNTVRCCCCCCCFSVYAIPSSVRLVTLSANDPSEEKTGPRVLKSCRTVQAPAGSTSSLPAISSSIRNSTPVTPSSRCSPFSTLPRAD